MRMMMHTLVTPTLGQPTAFKAYFGPSLDISTKFGTIATHK